MFFTVEVFRSQAMSEHRRTQIQSHRAALFLLFLVTLDCAGGSKSNQRAQPDLLLRHFMTESSFKDSLSEIRESQADPVPDFYPLPLGPPSAAEDPREDPRARTRTTMRDLSSALEDFGLVNVTRDTDAARFMLELYRRLEDGADLPSASGHQDMVDVALLQADTIRSLPAKGKNRKY